MSTRVFKLDQDADYWNAIREAAAILDGGGLVVFPTETVYGVAARADRSQGIERLVRVKRRTDNKPFTVHIGRRSEAERYIPDLNPLANRFIRRGWPGPLTLLVKTSDPAAAPIAAESDPATLEAIYHENTIGLRCPDDPRAADLLNEAGGPVVAASANLQGYKPPRTAAEAMADLDNGSIDLVLDGGPARYSKPSTIVRIDPSAQGGYEMVREGVYDARALDRFATLTILFVCTGNTCRSPMAIGIARQLVAQRLKCSIAQLADRSIHLISAGTIAGRGIPPSEHAVAVLNRRGVDISSHASQPLTIDLINRSDYIYTMTAAHRDTVVHLSPSAADRTMQVSGDNDIPDPLGAGADVYEQCARRIEEAVNNRLAEVPL